MSHSLKRTGTILSFLLPSFIGFIIFVLLPMIMAFGLSFTNYSGGPNFRFIDEELCRGLHESEF